MELQKRQDDIALTITAVEADQESLIIKAEGPAGRYGRVFLTYYLESDSTRDGGFCRGSGRGFPDEGPMMSGNFRGLWRRQGSKINMRNLVDVDNGDQNLDMITLDMHAKTVTISPYIIDWND